MVYLKDIQAMATVAVGVFLSDFSLVVFYMSFAFKPWEDFPSELFTSFYIIDRYTTSIRIL